MMLIMMTTKVTSTVRNLDEHRELSEMMTMLVKVVTS